MLTLAMFLVSGSLLLPPAGANPVFTCYNHVRLWGSVEAIDKAIQNVSGIFTVHTRTHRMDNNRVSADFLMSMTGLDEKNLRSHISNESVQQIFGVAGLPQASVAANFIGCSTVEAK